MHPIEPDLLDQSDAGDGIALPGDLAVGGDVDDRSAVRRWVPRVVVLVLVLLVAALLWLAFRGFQAGTALLEAEPAARSAQAALADGDVAGAGAALPALQAATDDAVAATDDPVWRAAGAVPWLGAQLRAVGDVSTALDLLTDEVLAPLVAAGGSLDPAALVPVDGAIDLGPLAAIAPEVMAAAVHAGDAEQLVAAIDPAPLVGPLGARVIDLQDALGGAASALATAADVVAVLPPMLGASELRTYLLLFLNNAELRTAGGIVGAVGVVQADGGRIELTGYRPSTDVERWPEPVLPLDVGEEGVHTDLLGRMLQNVTMSPHFPRSAELAAEMWLRSEGQEVDGVIGVDPVALSYLLEATGPVVSSGIELSSETVVTDLLSAAYLRHPDPDASDVFFAGAASAVFGALTTGRPAPQDLLTGLTRAVGEGRVTVWSVRADEQAVLGPGPLGGAFFDAANEGALGVFLDDGTAGKMDFYLETEITVADVTCAVDGTATATVQLELRSEVPADVSTLPDYVTGPRSTGIERGWIGTNITVYAPVGGALGQIRLGESVVGGRSGSETGREAVVIGSVLAPAESLILSADVVLAPGTDEVRVWATPALGSPGRVSAPACEASGPNG